jgi:hypothetical protein
MITSLIIISNLILGQFSLGAEIRNSLAFFSGNGKRTIFLQDQILFPNYEGFKLSGGLNTYNSILFGITYGDEDINTKILAEPFFSLPRYEPIFLHRLSFETKFKYLIFSGGKDSISLGSGIHNSVLLSHNIEPQKFLSGQIKNLPLPCIGDFCFGDISGLLGLVFVSDPNYKYPDPNFLIMRFEWGILFFRLGANRIIAFGGKGGVKPKTFQEYLDLFTGRLENASGICKYEQDEKKRKECEEYWASRDTNQAAGFYLITNIGQILDKLGVQLFDELAGYIEYAGDDIMACWQPEDRAAGMKCFPIPFGLLDIAWLLGISGKIGRFSFITEFTSTNKNKPFYAHHNYPLSVGGMYTGLHAGPFSDDLWIKMSGEILDGFYLGTRFHFTRRWAEKSSKSEDQERIYEFGPILAIDLDETTTAGISFMFFLFENPDLSSNPFEPQLKKGKKFLDFSFSLFFSKRF